MRSAQVRGPRTSSVSTSISHPTVKGLNYPRHKLLYSLPIKNTAGSFFGMAPGNKQIVQRTWGLQELEARSLSLRGDAGLAEQKRLTYGPHLKYDEFLAMPNRIVAAAFSFVFVFTFGALAAISPVCKTSHSYLLQYTHTFAAPLVSQEAGDPARLWPIRRNYDQRLVQIHEHLVFRAHHSFSQEIRRDCDEWQGRSGLSWNSR